MAGDQDTLARLAGGELRELLRMIEGTDIEELELEVGGTKLFFKRPAGARLPAADGAEASPLPGPHDAAFVVAERVGFFHFGADGPAEPPRVGDRVELGQVLGVIDSLSVPIPVAAPRDGLLDEILVEEGQPVEFGQPLFVIQPDGQ